MNFIQEKYPDVEIEIGELKKRGFEVILKNEEKELVLDIRRPAKTKGKEFMS